MGSNNGVVPEANTFAVSGITFFIIMSKLVDKGTPSPLLRFYKS